MKQIYRVDKSGNLAQAISEITAPKLLLLMSNNEQFEQHVEELERHFPGVPSIGCIGGSYGGQTVVCLLYTSPSPRDVEESRMPSSA